jgi:hypothetical protein
MADPAMCYQELAADYTVQRGKRRGHVVYLEADSAIDVVWPSDIAWLCFFFFFSKDIFQSRK